MAVLIFFAAPARTRIIAAYGFVSLYRSMGLLLRALSEIAPGGLHLAHVSARPGRTLRALRLLGRIAERHESLEQE